MTNTVLAKATMSFSQRLRVAMTVSEVTVEDLAEACGMSKNAIYKWRNGAAMPGDASIETICRVTGCSYSWLLHPYPVNTKAPDGTMDEHRVKQWALEVIYDLKGRGEL